jgi:hypothetical protein
MLTSELRYGDLWSMREFNHFDFELNGIIRAFLRTAVNDFMDSVHHIWCPLSSQEYQDLPDGAETTLTNLKQNDRLSSIASPDIAHKIGEKQQVKNKKGPPPAAME